MQYNGIEVKKMPRQARKKSASGIYHIMLRGINRQDIFEDDEDRQKFMETLRQYKEKIGYELYGYCLMSNHVHLLLKEGKESFSVTMKRISSSYVYWYNWKYKRCGHLFQERYKSEVVEDDEYLLTVLRYIHQNPVKAGIEKDIAEYKWSSHNAYMRNKEIIDIEFILKILSKEQNQAITRYKEYMMETNEDACLEYNEKYRVTDSELSGIIEEKYGITAGSFHLLDKQRKNGILREIKALEGVTIRQLVRVTGTSKFIVEKA